VRSLEFVASPLPGCNADSFVEDPQKELIDPALNGTRGILKAIVRSAPSVRRVVITSSFAAILSETKLQDPNTTFTEKSWNPDGLADIHRSPATAYRVSKLMAEHYAWDFVADKSNGANFDIVTVNPPTVFGPVVNHLASLDAINTSNARIVDCVQGKWKENGPAKSGPVCSWIDVRDVAKAHVLAGLELPDAGGHRLFTTAGIASNRELADVVRQNFPELRDRLPDPSVKGGEMPPADTMYKFDNSETKRILGFEWTPFETSIVDTVRSLKKFL
jgi:nucleoside-diphosphate-sugar epimerase